MIYEEGELYGLPRSLSCNQHNELFNETYTRNSSASLHAIVGYACLRYLFSRLFNLQPPKAYLY